MNTEKLDQTKTAPVRSGILKISDFIDQNFRGRMRPEFQEALLNAKYRAMGIDPLSNAWEEKAFEPTEMALLPYAEDLVNALDNQISLKGAPPAFVELREKLRDAVKEVSAQSQMSEVNTTTADEIVSAWEDKMSARTRAPGDYDQAAYEARRSFYVTDPGFEKYQALMAYLDCHELGPIPFATPEEELDAWRRTFGRGEEDLSREALSRVLSDHSQAMAAAYDAETDAALADIFL